MKKLKKDAIYLGAPFFLTGSPSKDFKFLEEKLEAKLTGWRSRCLSRAGRCILINLVAQAVPNYTLSSFKVLGKICNKLDAISRRFWWKLKESDRKYIACTAWDKLCCPKSQGGLGFKKANEVNSALLAKLAWMVISGKQTICMEVLRTKYKVSNSWLSVEPRKASSPTWRAIEAAKKLVVKGACFMSGDGMSIDVWTDPWVPSIDNFKPHPRVEEYNQIAIKASDLIDQPTRTWIRSLVNEIFTSDDANAILTIPIPFTPKQDRLIWLPNSKGRFSINLFTRSPSIIQRVILNPMLPG